MKHRILIIGFFIYSGFSYSQTYELKHLEDNQYSVRTVHRNIGKLCSHLFKNYDELQKDERGIVRTIVLDLRNDTLTIIDTDSTELRNKILFSYGKRSQDVRWGGSHKTYLEEQHNAGEIKED